MFLNVIYCLSLETQLLKACFKNCFLIENNKMKTFKELVREPGFAISLAIAFLLAGYNIAYGSWWMGFIFLVLIMGSIALNVWKTRKK